MIFYATKNVCFLEKKPKSTLFKDHLKKLGILEEYKKNILFSFLLNNVFVAANKPNAKRKKNSYIFTLLAHFASIKNNKQIIRENIVQGWFYETSIKIWRQISKSWGGP